MTELLKAPIRPLTRFEVAELCRLLSLGLSVRAIQRRLVHMAVDPSGYRGRRG